ncbi:MAG: NFACT family protein [Firmicutes bacterium]|nr:NFACT family protein [Bacillota bacterium]
MAFDGIVTMAAVCEMRPKLIMGKIDKIYQPESEELVFHIHTKQGNLKLYASVNPGAARIHFIRSQLQNPPAPLPFCMLLRKHIQGARITDITQTGSERIIEISLETLNELGFTVSKKLIFEIMGKHSNIILLDIASGKIIDSIKHVSIDVNRVRQLLPGIIYQYPPKQDKIPFKELLGDISAEQNYISANGLSPDASVIQKTIGGISPSFAEEMALSNNSVEFLKNTCKKIYLSEASPVVYTDDKGIPREFHVTTLSEYEDVCTAIPFDSLSECMEYYYNNKQSTNRIKQKSSDLLRTVSAQLDKLRLKEQRLKEDLLKAENSENLRLYGELLTANIHKIKPGAKSATVTNYYDGTAIDIPLNPTVSPAKNAQRYFKKYGKAKTAVKEKQLQLSANDNDINYLESVISYLENARDISEIDALRRELEETGYIRKRKIPGGFKEKKIKSDPYKYSIGDAFEILVGKNNKENDFLTFKTASSRDIWFHTKDIPGSHVILRASQNSGTNTLPPFEELPDEVIYAAASIAAYHSKGRKSENVPVDYVPVKYVKKPAGAKPGMVIFTNNRTVWVNPKLP